MLLYMARRVIHCRGGSCATAVSPAVASLLLLLLLLTATTAECTEQFIKQALHRGTSAMKADALADQLLHDTLTGVAGAGLEGETCNVRVHMEWTAQVGSGVFATPHIVDLHNDGKKEILVPTVTQFLEALDGATGEDVSGFPFAHPRFHSYASPLPVDIDGDGEKEWLVSMYTGELMLFGDDGKARGAIKVPPLPLKKDWRARNLTAAEAMTWRPRAPAVNGSLAEQMRIRQTLDWTETRRGRGVGRARADANSPKDVGRSTQLRAMQVEEVDKGLLGDAEVGRHGWYDREYGEIRDGLEGYDDSYDVAEDMYEDDNGEDFGEGFYERHRYPTGQYEGGQDIGPHGRLSPEAYRSMDLLWHQDLYKSRGNYEMEQDVFVFKNIRSSVDVEVAEDEVLVDPHILSTPVVVDVNADGDVDVMVHVSYYFDREYYSQPEKRGALPEDVDIAEYVASALVCMNLVTGEVKWIQMLQISTHHDEQPAYALSSPLIVNPNEDMLFDVFVTTPAGYVFGFDGRGVALRGWPRRMGPLSASCASEDVDGDGKVDICVGDIKGTVACFTGTGETIWERQVSGAVTDRVTFGDINGDGFVDLVVGTADGEIYALHGRTGANVPRFPYHAGGAILASALLVNLNSTAEQGLDGLHIIATAGDGVLYIVSGTTGCTQFIDIDEKASASVLADDLTGNGKLDLVVSTLSGTVMAFETDTPFHPRKAWSSKTKSVNGATASEGYVAVYIHPQSRGPYDVRGDTFSLTYVIEDQRRSAHATPRYHGYYAVSIFVGTRVLVLRKVHSSPGTYKVTLRAPLERMYASIHVVMTLRSGQVYQDSIALSFNMHFLETIKYSLIIPFLFVITALAFVRKKHEVPVEAYEHYERYHH